MNFVNELDTIKLSSSDIEKALATYPLYFSQVRMADVEWGMQPPPFVATFYNFVIDKGYIPQQAELWQAYVLDNEQWFTEASLSKEQTVGLKARFCRAYPSIIRDLHFGLLLKESGRFDAVLYNRALDYAHGIDLLVEVRGILFAVNLFTETRGGQYGRKKKERRHMPIKNAIIIELPVKFSGSKECGKFFLYSDREIEQLIKAVEPYPLFRN